MADEGTRFSQLSAEERANRLADPGTVSRFNSSKAGESTVWVGKARIDDHEVLLALTDGNQRGGTIGVEESASLSSWIGTATKTSSVAAIVICWDTGGVRVEEGPVALATASAVGTALARLAIVGPPVLSVVSGSRGCFGAPSVIAALSNCIIVTRGTHWGLTGPKLLVTGRIPATEETALDATSAENRARSGQADALVADSLEAIRKELRRRLARPPRPPRPARALDASVQRTEKLLRPLEQIGGHAGGVDEVRRAPQRDLLRFSFRGQWEPTGPRLDRGLVHASWGKLNGKPALSILVGAARRQELGIGIEEAHAITEMVRFAVNRPGKEKAPILIFVFCQGHAVDVEEERLGLHTALAECVRALVAARQLGHPLISVLGGGAYGAAYLALAAPSHRILAIRGTTVAPMAPRVLASFRRLKGLRESLEAKNDLADLIPDVAIVNSVVRLPRALRDALEEVVATAKPEVAKRKLRL